MRTSTGNLIGHLQDRHTIKIHSHRIDVNQRKISDMLLNKDSTIATVPHQDKKYLLARQMCLWFCRDLVAFNNSKKDGMNNSCRWAKIIGPTEDLPDKSTLSGTALNDIYCVVYGKVQEILKSKLPNVLGVSFDFWSDNVKRLYFINYWINWIDSHFRMQSVCLKNRIFSACRQQLFGAQQTV